MTAAKRTGEGIWTCWCGWTFATETLDIAGAAREHRKRHGCRSPLLVDGVDEEHARKKKRDISQVAK